MSSQRQEAAIDLVERLRKAAPLLDWGVLAETDNIEIGVKAEVIVNGTRISASTSVSPEMLILWTRCDLVDYLRLVLSHALVKEMTNISYEEV